MLGDVVQESVDEAQGAALGPGQESGARSRRQRLSLLQVDDLVKMDDTDIREAYYEEDAAIWALALAGAAPPVRSKVLEALPGDAAARLRQRLDRLGPFRLDDAESAQADLAERLRRLHDDGRITLPDPNGQEAILV